MNKLRFVVAALLACSSVHSTAAMSQSNCEAIVRATQSYGDFVSLVSECMQRSIEQEKKASDEAKELAAQKQAALARAEEARRALPYYLSDFRIAEIDTAGGVAVAADISNPNKASAIKYLEIRTTMYNAVGDRIRSDIGGHSSATLQFTGPLLNSQEPEVTRWDRVWYNTTAWCLKIDSMSVQLMNGKRINLSGAKLRDAIDPATKNICKAN